MDKHETMRDDIRTALAFEDATDRKVMDYFIGLGYTITRRPDLDRMDYDVTHGDSSVLLEVKTRDADSTEYETAWIRKDKVDAMENYSTTYGKPAWLMYIFRDGKFFLSDVDELRGYGTVRAKVFNPIKLMNTEENIEVPLSEKRLYDIRLNEKKSTFPNGTERRDDIR